MTVDNRNYASKLRDPKWQKKRLEIFDRDGWRCLFCGTEIRNIQVHHVVYGRRDPWDYPDDLYQTICSDCHEKRQQLTDKAVNALRIAIASVPTCRLSEVAQNVCDAAMSKIDFQP